MKIQDPIFGELSFNHFFWCRDTFIEFCGKETEISLMIDGEEDGEFSEKQYASYNALMQNWGKLQSEILESILDYYKQLRTEQEFDVSSNENYPLIETIDELLKHIKLVGIDVLSAKFFEGRYIGLTFDCTWDEENGVGIRLIDEKVVKVGYQDVAF